MPKLRLTQSGVERLKPPPRPRQIDYFDDLTRGLILRASHGGTKTWVALYYVRGKARAIKIGRHPEMSLVEARERTREILRSVARGDDPKAPKPRSPDTVDTVLAEFIERHVKPNCRTSKEITRLLKKEIITPWSGRLITDIARRDVAALLDAILDRGAPVVANHVHAHLRKAFNWGIERGILESNPMAGLRKPAKVMARDHVISDNELQALWVAWEQLTPPWGAFFKILLLTAQRRGEVARMRWQDVNLEERVWTIPREHAKNGRAHRVPLTDPVIDLLIRVPRVIESDGTEGEYVFNTAEGTVPLSGFSCAKTLVDNAVADLVSSEQYCKVRPWRIHDLRRTAATGMARLGTPPHVLSAILNHSPSSSLGITAVYVKFSFDGEKRTALETWARHVSLLTTGTANNVIPFVRR